MVEKILRSPYAPWFAVLAVIVLAAGFLAAGSVSVARNTMAPLEGPHLIVLDPGHGGVDGGTSGADGTLEKDLNLQIALKLRDLLRLSGYTVIMTRETDVSIHDASCKTIREKKVSDLKNRLAMIEANPGCVFVSIHQNTFPISKYGGTQVFYSPNRDDGARLADSVQNQIQTLLQPGNDRVAKPIGKESFIMNKTTALAVMVECGFLSNSGDLASLKDEVYQSKLAFSVLCGLLQYDTDGSF